MDSFYQTSLEVQNLIQDYATKYDYELNDALSNNVSSKEQFYAYEYSNPNVKSDRNQPNKGSNRSNKITEKKEEYNFERYPYCL